MELWPEDDQNNGQAKSKKSGKRKGKITFSGTPYLDTGRLEAVTLTESKSHLEWTSPLHVSRGPKLVAGASVDLFRPTRPPRLDVSSASIVQRAEHGANFLRTYFPDIDITAELVRQELSADAQFSRELEQYDPFLGNVLELQHVAPLFVAFPMGVIGCDLNILPLKRIEGQDFALDHPVAPVKSLPTPILQLASFQFPVHELDTFLGVRTFGSTALLRVRRFSDRSDLNISESAFVVRDDVGQRPPIDIKFHSRQPDMLLVNDEGGVYKYGLKNGQKQSVYVSNKNPDSGDKYWQLASAGYIEDGCLLSSSKTVQELDFRTSNLALNLLTVTTNEKLTCIEDSDEDHLFRLASTERVLWLDRRFPGRPLLGIKHRRNYDRTLTVRTLKIGGHHHSLVTSRKNKLITIYDVARSADQLLHMHNMPYSFSLDIPESQSSGDAFVNVGDQVKMLRISERGRISCISLAYRDTLGPASTGATQSRPTETQDLFPDVGTLGAREYSKTNLRPAYEQIFPSVDQINMEEEKDSEIVYDLLEQIPDFWQKADTPVEHMLTTYDILFRAGEEPSVLSRSDFLAETVFNSTRGYRILSQDRLPVETLVKGSPWHFNVAPTLGHLDKSTTGDIDTISERLRTFDLSPQTEVLIQASRRQDKAREQLALDLSLSKDIFSPKPFSQSSRKSTGAAGTEELLSSPSSAFHFHYLQPMPKSDYYSKSTQEQEEDSITIPVGAGMLLDEWDIGADPEKYVFNDTYSVDTDSNREAKSRAQRKRGTTVQPQYTPPSNFQPETQQLPPSIVVLPATQLTTLPRIAGVESQSTQIMELESQGGLMMSTQVLPGPFGGRPTGKKKPPKKRLGGF